jgi:hypothetical protein
MKKPPQKRSFVSINRFETDRLALTRFVAGLGLVDDVNAALAADQLVVAVAITQRLEAVTDLHRLSHFFPKRPVEGPKHQATE